MASVKTTAAQGVFAGDARKNIEDAAGPDRLVSRADQAKLDPWIAGRADAMRAEKKGARITVDALVDRTMSDAMNAWSAHNTTGKTWLSRAEVRSIGQQDPQLGVLTARAVESSRSPAPIVPAVTIGEGATLARNGDTFTISTTLPVGANVTLLVDGHAIELRRFAQALRAIDMDANVPEGYGYESLGFSGDASGAQATVRITRDPPGYKSFAEALAIARESIRDHVENHRVNDPDWKSAFEGGMTWEQAVAHGALEDIAKFGTPDPSTTIDRHPDRYVITGRGPLNLYTEATIRKRDGKLMNVLVEID